MELEQPYKEPDQLAIGSIEPENKFVKFLQKFWVFPTLNGGARGCFNFKFGKGK